MPNQLSTSFIPFWLKKVCHGLNSLKPGTERIKHYYTCATLSPRMLHCSSIEPAWPKKIMTFIKTFNTIKVSPLRNQFFRTNFHFTIKKASSSCSIFFVKFKKLVSGCDMEACLTNCIYLIMKHSVLEGLICLRTLLIGCIEQIWNYQSPTLER